MKGRSASEWIRTALLGLVPLLLARPLVGAEGQFRLLLDGEAGLRDDGNYGLQNLAVSQRNETLARAGLDLQLSYALQRLNLALGYAPSYERSVHDASLSGTTHRLDFGLLGDLTRTLQLDVHDRLLKTPNLDLYAPAATPDTTVVTRRGDQLNNTADVSFNQAFSHRATLLIGVTHDLHQYQDANLHDSEALTGRIGAAFDLTRGQRVEAAAGIGRYDYKQLGSSDIRTLGIAYATDLGRSNHVRIEGGVYSVSSTVQPSGTPAAAERFTDQGWRGALQLAGERRLFHWNLGLSHDISPGAGLGRAVTADNAFAGVSTAVGRHLTLGLDGNGSRQRDLGAARTAFPQGGNDGALTEFAAGTARFGWALTQTFRLDGGYSRVWQRSAVPAFANLSYARYFLSLVFRIYSTGETPVAPENLGRLSADEKSDSQ
ncbi:MAG TPA: hypothetical protein VGH73_08200 [Thermoanaerobaculia bacterium]|jgi:hypothetical protein